MSEETKVTIGGKEYTVDIDKAKRDGYLKEVRPPIADIKPGDVFKMPNSDAIPRIIIKHSDDKFSGFSLTGYWNSCFQSVPDSYPEGLKRTKKDMEEFLKDYIYLGNIADKVNKMVADLANKVGKDAGL